MFPCFGCCRKRFAQIQVKTPNTKLRIPQRVIYIGTVPLVARPGTARLSSPAPAPAPTLVHYAVQPDQFDAAAGQSFQVALAARLEVAPHRIQVVSVLPGSTVVVFQVCPAAAERAEEGTGVSHPISPEPQVPRTWSSATHSGLHRSWGGGRGSDVLERLYTAGGGGGTSPDPQPPSLPGGGGGVSAWFPPPLSEQRFRPPVATGPWALNNAPPMPVWMDHARFCRGVFCRGCSWDEHRNDWRCARALRERHQG